MPLDVTWKPATRTHVREHVPRKQGVYELRCFGQLVYIGHSTNLQRRLLEHIGNRSPNKYRIKTLWWFQNPQKHEDKHLTAYEREHGTLPPWNKRDTRVWK